MKRFLFTALFAVACSSSSESSTASGDDSAATGDTAAIDDSSTVDDSTTPDDTSSPLDSMIAEVLGDAPMDVGFGPYPPAPYGNKVGDVMANLQWEGYVNDLADAISNTKPYVASTSMDELRKKASKGYALVHVSEFY
ncbi:MAG: hypothetical protein ACXWUG_20560 [Polyangiales bacterium]